MPDGIGILNVHQLITTELLAVVNQARRSLLFHYNRSALPSRRSIPKPPRTPIAFNKSPDPKAIDHLPRHHQHLINFNDDQRLQSNHPPIPLIDHSSRQNHNPLLTANSIAPQRKHRQLTGKGFNVPKASLPHDRRTTSLRANI
jgi:hypothetical protein